MANCSVSSLSRQWPLTWLSGIFVLCKSILPLFAAKLFRAAFNFRHFERNCQYFQQNSHHRIISQKNYTETKVSRPELKYQFVILKYINSFFLSSLCWKLSLIFRFLIKLRNSKYFFFTFINYLLSQSPVYKSGRILD